MISTTFAVFFAAFGIYVSLILFTRITGLRSFSKLSSFDFAITVAFGSIIAGVVISKDPPLFPAILGLASLYFFQMALSFLRRRFSLISSVVDNQPLLLMTGGEIIEENMHIAKITKADLRAKLREANVIEYDEIFAVVMETTGDVSVLHGDPSKKELEPELLDGVRGAVRM